MQPLRTHEQGWLDAMRQVWGRVFIGLDHHSRQVTIAAAAGEQFQANRAAQSANWMLTSIFDQDGLGYADLLDWLTTNFPTTPRDRFVFASEPTFSKPLASFLISAGFCADQILWVKTTEVGPYRKAKGIGKAGKNDTDDSRALATMAFEAAADPHEHRSLFIAAPCSPVADGLRYLAMDHERVTKYSVSLQNRITDLALRLFPECRRVWYRDEKSRKPDGSVYEQRLISLFDTELPMKILEKFPSAQDVAEAGFDELWRLFGGRGLRKQVFLDLVSLAQRSGGTRNPLDAKRLCSMIQEYQQARERLGTYRDLIQVVAGADPVLKSFESIAFLGPQAIATIVGELGDVSRFKDFNAVKRYVNVAPVPMPQTGNVDETGRPVQVWRLSANTYKTSNGQRQLVYEARGLKTVRHVAYLWFEVLVRCGRFSPDDPFVVLYHRHRLQHQGETRWFGKVRWKVIAKLIGTIYHCLRTGVVYDPHQVLGSPMPNTPAA